jgi:hypothetical protein
MVSFSLHESFYGCYWLKSWRIPLSELRIPVFSTTGTQSSFFIEGCRILYKNRPFGLAAFGQSEKQGLIVLM